MWLSLTNWILAAVKTGLYLFTKLIFSIYCQIYPFTWKFSVYCRTGLAQVRGIGFDSKMQSNVGIDKNNSLHCTCISFPFLKLSYSCELSEETTSFANTDLRSSLLKVFYERSFTKNFAKFTGKSLCRSQFFNAAVGWKPTTLL